MSCGLVTEIRLGTDNVFAVTLYDGATPYTQTQMSEIQRVAIEIDDGLGSVFDTNTTPGVLSWTTLVQVDGVDTYPIQGVGADLGIPVGTYMDCRLKIYDTSHPDGLEWPAPLSILVNP